MDQLRIALVQLEIRDGQPRVNLDRALTAIQEAAPADLYILPELWTTGYAHDSWGRAAAVDTPIICAELARLSTELGVVIAGSMISLDQGGKLRNRLWVFGPHDGAPVTYDKGHLFAPLGEERYLTPGVARIRLPLGPWTVALSICFDLRFPEMYRLDALGGADLFLVASAWPSARAEALRLLARVRALENQAFLALCNRSGTGGDGLHFGGGSIVVAPDGEILADAGEGEGVAEVMIEHGRVAEVRNGFAVLSKRARGLDW
jgi:predicted amidohydrolase